MGLVWTPSKKRSVYDLNCYTYVFACSAGARLVATGSFLRTHIGEFIDAHFKGDLTFGMLVIVCDDSLDCFDKNLEPFVFVVLIAVGFIMFTLKNKRIS